MGNVMAIWMEVLIERLEYGQRVEAADMIDRILERMNRDGHAPEIEFSQLEFLLGTLADYLRN